MPLLAASLGGNLSIARTCKLVSFGIGSAFVVHSTFRWKQPTEERSRPADHFNPMVPLEGAEQQDLQTRRTIASFLSLIKDDIRFWIFAGAKHLNLLVGHIFGE